ncbi:MAG: hypothetical protein VB042_05390 [Victivallaceae bacterium]|nr:hypothetical protein [Victivallaceae bacterium]
MATIPQVPDAIKDQMATVEAARSRQAVGAEAASDYEMIDGIKFFKPTFAHTWFVQRVAAMPVSDPSLSDFGVIVTASLLMDSVAVRNEVIPLADDRQKLATWAYGMLIQFSVELDTVNTVLTGIAAPLLKKTVNMTVKKQARSSRAGGQS